MKEEKARNWLCRKISKSPFSKKERKKKENKAGRTLLA